MTDAPSASHDDRDVFQTPPTSATIPVDDDDDGDDEDEVHCLQRLHSTSEVITVRSHHSHQHRSFSTVTETYSAALPDPFTDVGGVSVRSAPDSAVPVRPPEVVQSHAGQRSKLQRFFEPLKRSKSAGNNKTGVAATQASLYNPTHHQVTSLLTYLIFDA